MHGATAGDEEYVRTDKEARRGALDREDEAEAISLDTEAETEAQHNKRQRQPLLALRADQEANRR